MIKRILRYKTILKQRAKMADDGFKNE